MECDCWESVECDCWESVECDCWEIWSMTVGRGV